MYGCRWEVFLGAVKDLLVSTPGVFRETKVFVALPFLLMSAAGVLLTLHVLLLDVTDVSVCVSLFV